MMRALAALLLAACVHMHQRPARINAMLAPDQVARCRSLDTRVMVLHLVGIISSSGGSGAATGAGIFGGTARYVLAGVGGGLALVGAITGYLSTWYAAKYVKECP